MENKGCYFGQHIWFKPTDGTPCNCGEMLWGVDANIKKPEPEMDWEALKRQSNALLRRKAFYVIKGGKH